MMNRLSAWVVLILLGTIAPVWANERSSSTDVISHDQRIGEVVSRLVGTMDTSAQAATNPKIANVQMITCRVRVANPSPQAKEAVFLYQEQGMADKLAKPYRQRFLRIAPSIYSQSIESLSFKPDNLSAWVGLCNKPEGDRTVQRRDLGQPICSVFLRKTGSVYVGNTPVDGCPAKVRGAVRITNRVILHETGMDTWDRGFDAQGKQVWGAESDSYQFRRRQ
jgi:hypothetical protein